MRAITTAVAVALLGPAVLATLRRAARRARITTPAEPSPAPVETSPIRVE